MEPPPDLTSTVWRDDLWLAHYPLNAATVLDYLANSPFYDLGCNNEKAKLQGLDPSRLQQLAPGLEFVLQEVQEPRLYVVKRQWRAGPGAGPTALAVYYVLDGSIYQAPLLRSCLASRIERCSHHLKAAYRTLRADLDPLAQGEAAEAAELRSSLAAAAAAAAALPAKRLGDAERERQRTADRVLAAVLKQYPVPEPPTPPQNLPPAPGGPTPTEGQTQEGPKGG